MKSRHLVLIVCVLLVLLLVGTLMRRRGSRPVAGNLASQVKLVRLLDDAFTGESVRGLTLSRKIESAPNSGSDQVLREVRLIRGDGGEWLVASAFHAPANAMKIKDFLAGLRALRGDLQAESQSSHAGLGVDADSALRLELAANDGKSAILYAGERAGGAYGESYVRREGEDLVYRVNLDVRRSAGMSSAASPAPAARDWLELGLVDIPAGEMRRVILEYPEGRLVMAREKQVDGVWKLEDGGAAEKFKPDRLESWTKDAAALIAEDAADPALAANAETASGIFSLSVSADDRPDFTLRVWTDGDRHYAISSIRTNLVYAITEANRSRLFPPNTEFFTEDPAPEEKETGPEQTGDVNENP